MLAERDLEPAAVIRHLEAQTPLLFPDANRRSCPVSGVLRRVLERLQAAEVHRRLDVLAIAAGSVRLDASENGCATRRRGQGVREPAVLEERRVDPVSELAQALLSILDHADELIEHELGLVRIRVRELPSEAKLDGQPDEVLLRSVMQIAFDSPPLGVPSRDDPSARRLKLRRLLSQLLQRSLQLGVEPHIP